MALLKNQIIARGGAERGSPAALGEFTVNHGIIGCARASI